MPVTFEPAKHAAQPFKQERLSALLATSESFLTKTTKDAEPRKVRELLQSSFAKEPTNTVHCTNGFVDTVIEAYNQHRALVVRPDDVWLAILTQFSIFVNNNAEELRSSFVAHEGKKTLRVTAVGTRYTVDFGALAQQMTHLIDENVVDPSLRQWIIPNFTTTTPNDTTVAAVVMMATMKAYFSYEMMLMCGIPLVTLEGTKEDWEKILGRLEKLKEYGIQTIAWYHLLRPVISRFVSAFDDPNGPDNLEFWNKVAHFEFGGSGPNYRAGWITAFCVFNTGKRKWQGEPFKEDIPKLVGGADTSEAAALSTADFLAKYIRKYSKELYLVLDDARYPWIDSDKIPAGFAEVDVKLNDNGAEYDTTMVAGSVGMQVSGDKKDTVSPVAGWWIYITPDQAG